MSWLRSLPVPARSSRRRLSRRRAGPPRLEALEDRQLLATFTVRTNFDGGPGSLRDAILAANTNSGPDTIDFAIDTGNLTIAPKSALPPILDPVTIDGTTQPGFAGTPIVTLDGANAVSADGLTLLSTDCLIRGLVIRRFQDPQRLLGAGIRILDGSGNTITGNAIAFNGGAGVVVTNGNGNAIRANSIFNNGGLGIDLVGDGPTLNDPGDLDIGPNDLQNFPDLTEALAGSSTIIRGKLNSLPSSSFVLDFFANSVLDPTGFGEGERYLGSLTVNTDAQGQAAFEATLSTPVVPGAFITGTAIVQTIGPKPGTSAAINDSSEFSAGIRALPILSINNVSQAEGNAGQTAFDFTVTLSAPSTVPVTVSFATADQTATAPGDYQPVSGTLTFNPNETTQTIRVQVNGDTTVEPDETFLVRLSAPVNAGLAPGQDTGVGTIVNDDVPTLSINNVSLNEGNSGTTPFAFTVTLSSPSSQTVTVDFQTSNGSAAAPGDFQALSGTLTFTPSQTSQPITVQIVGDNVFEFNEAFQVILSNPVNATLQPGQAAGTGTILNDDSVPTIAIQPVSMFEGNSGNTVFVFPVTLSNPSSQQISVGFNTLDGTATQPTDYSSLVGSVTFNPGETSGTIRVPVKGDTVVEPDETFTVRLVFPVNATLAPGQSQATGTILNDDGVPTLSINNVSKNEGNSGTTPFTFTVSLSSAPNQQVTVNFQTADGTAQAGSDYQATSGSLTFAVGETTKPITVPVIGDLALEADETFTVKLSNPAGAILPPGNDVGTGTILNDDTAPALSINNVSLAEGNSGTTAFVFTVSLSSSSTQTVTVDFQTADGTATASSDYQLTSGTLTFTPGQTSQPIAVPVSGDTLFEADETFTVNLSNAVNAVVSPSSGTGQGTILNDDTAPTLAITNVSLTEGNSGTTAFVFNVTLSAPSGVAAMVDFQTANGTAVAGSDYQATSGKLTFTPGQTLRTITVPVTGDTLFEADETFSVNLSNPVNTTLPPGPGQGTIVNDDAQPSLSIAGVSAPEGNSGTTNFDFTVTLSSASGQVATVAFTTQNGTATAPGDYATTTGTLTFNPGDLSKTIRVPVVGDTVVEPDETFLVRLQSPTGATLSSGQDTAQGTIVNDDGIPSISISNVSQAEGNSGTTPFVFTITLSNANSQAVTVDFQTVDGTAVAGSDYQAASGTITFAPGETSQPVTVQVNGDTTLEADETFAVSLSNPVNAFLPAGFTPGQGTIVNDDAGPNLAITNVSLAEGDSGTTAFVFTVTLAAPSELTATVNFQTASGTAVAGSDFQAASGTLTFAPGQTSQPITVQVIGDTVFELDETFAVNLSNAINATLPPGRGSGAGTILNDDPQPSLSIAGVSSAEGNSGTTDFVFAVSLSNASSQVVTVNFVTLDGTATAPGDYLARAGTVTFAPGELSRTIGVPVVGDTVFEPDETFFVRLQSASGATINQETDTAQGTILNDDGVPNLAIGNVSLLEGNSGTTNFDFTVTLSSASSLAVTVAFSTTDGSAIAPGDYTALSGTVTFNPGELSQTVRVQVNGDLDIEPAETFTVVLSKANNAVIGAGQGIGLATIRNDDFPPQLQLSGVSLPEGNSGTTAFTFQLQLSKPATQLVTADFFTIGDTATSGVDFQPATGSVSFASGVTSAQVTVLVNGDTDFEPDERFFLRVANVKNATLVNGLDSALGIIVNDDVAADLAVAKVASPDPVTVGAPLTYTITVTNQGPSLATSVVLQDMLPAGLLFVSATPSQGTLTGSNPLTVNVASLASGASFTLTIVAIPTQVGVISNGATVRATEPDLDLTNNAVKIDTTVNPRPPVTLVASGTVSSAVETIPFTGVVATFISTDPNGVVGQFTATIDWGDGGPPTAGVISQPGGPGAPFAVAGSHVYVDEADYPVTVTVGDTANLLQAVANSSVHVGDAPLHATGITLSLAVNQVYTGIVANFTDVAGVEPLTNYSALINWGDGTLAVAAAVARTGNTFQVTGSHSFPSPATYFVRITIQDVGGSFTNALTTIRVVDQPPPRITEPSVPGITLLNDKRNNQDIALLLLTLGPETRPIPPERLRDVSGPGRRPTFFDQASGFSATGEIYGRVFEDLNGDGIQQPGEAGLGGQIVYLDLNKNGLWDPGEPVTVTKPNGEYSFSGLEYGPYIVRQLRRSSMQQTFPFPATNGHEVMLSPTESIMTNKHFGYYKRQQKPMRPTGNDGSRLPRQENTPSAGPSTELGPTPFVFEQPDLAWWKRCLTLAFEDRLETDADGAGQPTPATGKLEPVADRASFAGAGWILTGMFVLPWLHAQLQRRANPEPARTPPRLPEPTSSLKTDKNVHPTPA